MGIITRLAANNITTSGVILPAGINDASVASITGLAQVSAGDGITLISSQTASASASLSFTGIDSTYRTYMFKFINMHPATDNVSFDMNMSTDGGSNYNVTKTSTAFRTAHDEADSATAVSYESAQDLAQSTAYQKLFNPDMGNGNDESTSGTLYLFNPSNTTFVKHFLSCVNYYNTSNYTCEMFIGGYCNTTSAVNAIRFQMSSGNIDAGTIYMYGIEKT
jgi:hypothetical protein